jgi:hypothetical protein
MYAVDDRKRKQNDPSQHQEDLKMKREFAISLSAASLVLVLFLAPYLHARTESGTTSMDYSTNSVSGDQRQAELMVPAQAVLKTRLDARKLHTGDTFQANLTRKAALKNGPELPSGTVLVGTVAIEQTGNGPSRLVLRFTQAKMKDGSVVSIRAMIAGVFDAAADFYTWGQHDLQIRQLNAVSGTNLYSEIASEDSGVFVADNVKNLTLPPGMILRLALAPAESR